MTRKYSNGKPRPEFILKPPLTRPVESMKLHLDIPRPIWKELSLMAVAHDKNIKAVAVECLLRFFDSIPPAERLKPMSNSGPLREGPVLRGTYALAEKKPAPTPAEARPEPEPEPEPPPLTQPKPAWSDIWVRLKDHLYEQPCWDELQSHLKGTQPPNDFLQWKLERQLAWLNAYVPLQ